MRRVLLISGIAAMTVGAILTAMWVLATVRDTEPEAAPTPTGSFTVDVTADSATTATMEIGFGVAGTEWQVDDLTFGLPGGVRHTEAPEGWTSDQGATTVECTTSTPSPTGGTFGFESVEGWADLEYDVVLHAHAGDTAFTGQASGFFDPDGDAGTP